MKMKSVDVWTKLDCSGAVITNLISQVLTVVSAYKTFLKFSFPLQKIHSLSCSF